MEYKPISIKHHLYKQMFSVAENEGTNVYRLAGSAIALFQFVDFDMYLIEGFHKQIKYQERCAAAFESERPNFLDFSKAIASIAKSTAPYELNSLLSEWMEIRSEFMHEEIYNLDEHKEGKLDPDSQFVKYAKFYASIFYKFDKITDLYYDYVIKENMGLAIKYGYLKDDGKGIYFHSKFISELFNDPNNKEKLDFITFSVGAVFLNYLTCELFIRNAFRFLFEMQGRDSVGSRETVFDLLSRVNTLDNDIQEAIKDVLDVEEIESISFLRNECVHRLFLRFCMEIFDAKQKNIEGILDKYYESLMDIGIKSFDILSKVAKFTERCAILSGNISDALEANNPLEFVIPNDNILRNRYLELYFEGKGIRLKYSDVDTRKEIYSKSKEWKLFDLYAQEIYDKMSNDWNDHCEFTDNPKFSFFNAIKNFKFVFIGNNFIESKNEIRRKQTIDYICNWFDEYKQSIKSEKLAALLDEISKDCFVYEKMEYDGKPQGTVRLVWNPKKKWPKHIAFYIKALLFKYIVGAGYEYIIFDDLPSIMLHVDWL